MEAKTRKVFLEMDASKNDSHASFSIQSCQAEGMSLTCKEHRPKKNEKGFFELSCDCPDPLPNRHAHSSWKTMIHCLYNFIVQVKNRVFILYCYSYFF